MCAAGSVFKRSGFCVVGHAGEGLYEPVVRGEADSCDRIKLWWDAVRQAEADRIAGGQYPCGYLAAYEYDRSRPDWNGPPFMVGCWPTHPIPGEPLDDAEAEVNRLETTMFAKFPPNHPAFVEAVYDCYKEALEGPPPGWVQPYDGASWTTLPRCHNVLYVFGRPILELGVDPECAARQYAGKIATLHVRHPRFDASNAYADDYSWANCSTTASRLVPEGLTTYAERCSSVIDASVGPKTDELAEAYGVSRSQVVAFLKTLICEDGTKEGLRQYPQFHGDFVAGWTPPEGSICYEEVMLNVARAAVRQEWIRVAYC